MSSEPSELTESSVELGEKNSQKSKVKHWLRMAMSGYASTVISIGMKALPLGASTARLPSSESVLLHLANIGITDISSVPNVAILSRRAKLTSKKMAMPGA
jgi:hypothetical protein